MNARSHRMIVGSLLLSLPLLVGTGECPAGGASIRGRVTDAVTGFPLESVNIFLAGTTLGTVTDTDGCFDLRGVPSGTHRLVASRIGYKSAAATIDLGVEDLSGQAIALEPRDVLAEEVTVEAEEPEEWRKCLERFIPAFIGRGPFASSCSIVNPEVMNFQPVESWNELIAWSDSALVIDNFSLGYRVSVIVERFEWNTQDDLGVYLIYPRFRELTPVSESERVGWEGTRRKAYRGSMKHFLSLLVRGALEESEFVVYRDRSSTEVMWPGEITVRPAPKADQRMVHFSGWIRVEDTGEIPPRTSFVRMRELYARVDTLGNLLSPFAIQVGGAWARDRVSDLLPLF